jgi:hypothetical protein
MVRSDEGVVLEAIARRLAVGGAAPSAQGIAGAIGALVTDGGLGPGDRLPTVRALAGHLGVSPTTVSEAWRILARHGAIATDRRRGTTIRSTRVGAAGRYWQVPVEPGTLALDLSTGTPDPALLPPLGPVLASLHAEVMVTSYNDRPVLPDLEEVLRARWPCVPEALTVVDGAQDALDRIVTAHVRLGDTVVVEDPGFPPLLDMLELAGARVVGVAVDRHGIEVDALADALATEPSAVFVQPRAHNPTGASFDADRAAAIAALLEPTDALIVEDDHSGEVSGVDLHSIAGHLPDRVLHVRSFSKTHGPDLRVAAIGGPAAALDPIVTAAVWGRPGPAASPSASCWRCSPTPPSRRRSRRRRPPMQTGARCSPQGWPVGRRPRPGHGTEPVARRRRRTTRGRGAGRERHRRGAGCAVPRRRATENIRISLGAAGDDLDRVAAAVASAAAAGPQPLERRDHHSSAVVADTVRSAKLVRRRDTPGRTEMCWRWMRS